MPPQKAAIWARVSTSDQHAVNQLDQLREWAARRGLDVAEGAEFVTEDSAWANGNGKGAEFDKARADLINGARLGHYSVILIWAIDRLSRRGVEDTLATLRKIYECDCDVWSHQEDWLRTSHPDMREMLVSLFAWVARQESARRSERIKAGLARRRREGLTVGGRKAGAKDKRQRATDGYRAAWAAGGALRQAADRRRAAKDA
jgi:DNA invertase Pin-like site-specific DNA recombinase